VCQYEFHSDEKPLELFISDFTMPRHKPSAIDVDLPQKFISALPDHVYQLVKSCKIKATSCSESRSIILLSPDQDHAECLLAQAELKQVAESLGVTSLRVIWVR